MVQPLECFEYRRTNATNAEFDEQYESEIIYGNWLAEVGKGV